MTSPKTEAERIDRAAWDHTLTLDPSYQLTNAPDVICVDQFKAGVAWRDANPLPHKDRGEEFFVSVIEKWQFTWMDVKGTDEKDRANYYSKAHMIDANMRYSLARMLVKTMKEEKK